MRCIGHCSRPDPSGWHLAFLPLSRDQSLSRVSSPRAKHCLHCVMWYYEYGSKAVLYCSLSLLAYTLLGHCDSNVGPASHRKLVSAHLFGSFFCIKVINSVTRARPNCPRKQTWLLPRFRLSTCLDLEQARRSLESLYFDKAVLLELSFRVTHLPVGHLARPRPRNQEQNSKVIFYTLCVFRLSSWATKTQLAAFVN